MDSCVRAKSVNSASAIQLYSSSKLEFKLCVGTRVFVSYFGFWLSFRPTNCNRNISLLIFFNP